MKLRNLLAIIVPLFAAGCLCSCDDSKSYAEMLTDEAHYINEFLANNIVIASIPADTVFEIGEDAPYYKIDEDGNLYMQVLNPGTKGNMAVADELLYFRFTRYDLRYYDAATNTFTTSWGNESDLGLLNASFRFQNFTLQSSYQWGIGIQTPLLYLPVDCEVNLVVKSRYGLTDEESSVVPYLYHLRYFRPKV